MRINLGSMSLARKIDIGPYIEYRLLTNIKKPQNVFMVGLAADWATREPKTEERRWSAVVIWSINYKNDFELATKSVQTNLLFTPVANDRGRRSQKSLLPECPDAVGLGCGAHLPARPSVSSTRACCARRTNLSNGPLSGQCLGGAELLPLPGHLARRLELNFEYSYVYDLMESTDPDGLNRGHQLVAADANVWFVRTDAGRLAGMSLRYTNGESPKAGFRQQQRTELTISVKF